MANQGPNDLFDGTNNDPLSPVGAVTDSYSNMSLSGIMLDIDTHVNYGEMSRMQHMQQLLDESLEFETRIVQSIGPVSCHEIGNIMAQAMESAQILNESTHQSTVLASEQQFISDQPTDKPQIVITNQPLPNDFKFR